MNQLLLNKNSGKIIIEEQPSPALIGNGAIVKTSYSVISSGTELSMISRARETKLQALKRMMPEDGFGAYIKRKLASGTLIRSSKGVMSTLNESSKAGFGSLIPLGYSSSGVVINKDTRVTAADVGEQVACAGARHAGVNYVPVNLFTRLSQGVDLKEACFTTLGCIAMQGLRRAEVAPGELVVIIGQGLIGQIAAQLVRASGAYAVVSDLSQYRLNIAKNLGAYKIINAAEQDSVKEVLKCSAGVGADKVIICAASSSSKPIRDAIYMSRDKGKIVLVGVAKIDIPRAAFYEKELDFLISRSYGPGRYDPVYEQKGFDYPLDEVRWTENRNMQDFIRLLAEKKMRISPLITREFNISQAQEAYQHIMDNPQTTLGVILKYDQKSNCQEAKMFLNKQQKLEKDMIKTAIIGCGSFARKYHLPNINKISDYQLISVANATGLNAKQIAKKNNLKYCTTDYRDIISDPDVDLAIIATRHNLHAKQATEALNAGKHVFLEKPMALTLDEASKLASVAEKTDKKFTIGFNRRFSPLVGKAKQLIANHGSPLVINYRVANTFIPKNAWVHDPQEGGGTIIGECCHFFDLVYWLTEKEPVRIFAEGGNLTHPGTDIYDNALITVKFSDNSVATIIFTDLGCEDFPKERIEIFAGEQVIVINDFKEMSICGQKEEKIVLKQADKGHFNQFVEFAAAIKNDTLPAVTSCDGLRATSCCLRTLESLKSGLPVSIKK